MKLNNEIQVLEQEIGDLLCMLDLCIEHGIVTEAAGNNTDISGATCSSGENEYRMNLLYMNK